MPTPLVSDPATHLWPISRSTSPHRLCWAPLSLLLLPPQGKLVSAMMKKHLVEGVVPLLVELKVDVLHVERVCYVCWLP